MEPEPDGKIVVYEKYRSVIDANVVKTKLDAYGIPCFLSNENISHLYPLPHMPGFEVILHIFDHDRDRVVEVLTQPE